jgi:hypothetical protein
VTRRSYSNVPRRVSTKARRPQLLIFSEGSKTESIYLTHWHRVYRESIIVHIADHKETSPYQIVERAVRRRADDLYEERHGRGSAYDEYWCIFDVDEHPRIPEALQLAESNSINIALSGPNIELWFLIHFQPQRAWIHRDDSKTRAYQFLGCGKALSLPALAMLTDDGRYLTARERAQSLEAMHQGDGSLPPWNPSSDVWKLIDAIRSSEI